MQKMPFQLAAKQLQITNFLINVHLTVYIDLQLDRNDFIFFADADLYTDPCQVVLWKLCKDTKCMVQEVLEPSARSHRDFE